MFNKYLTGVGYRPQPPEANVESTLITFKHSKKPEAGTWDTWVERLKKFLVRKLFKSYKYLYLFLRCVVYRSLYKNDVTLIFIINID
jgi:hypothetical protein